MTRRKSALRGSTERLWADIPWLAKAMKDASLSNWGVSRLSAIAAVRRIVGVSPLAQAFLNASRAGVVGSTTPTPNFSAVKNKKDRPKLQELWAKFAEEPTTEGTDNLAGVLRALFSSMLVDGRVFCILRRHEDYPCGLALMPLERDWLADQSSNGEEHEYGGRKAVNGVIRSVSGRIDSYVFYGKLSAEEVIRERSQYRTIQIFGQNDRKDARIIPASQVIDMFDARFASDYEGAISHLLPALRKMQSIARLDDALVTAMETSATLYGFITKDKEAPADATLAEEEGDDYVENPDEFQAGVIEHLTRGSDFKEFKINAPSGDISKYRSEIIMNIAASLACDFASLSGDLRGVNYSSLRHASIMAQENHKIYQQVIERKVMRPLLKALLATAQLRGDVSITKPSMDEALRTEWRMRAFPWVDPVADIQAAAEGIKIGVNSPQRIAQMQGIDFAQVAEELKEAKRLLTAAGLPFPADQPSQPDSAPGQPKKPKSDSAKDDPKGESKPKK